jgi:hypothetical protein
VVSIANRSANKNSQKESHLIGRFKSFSRAHYGVCTFSNLESKSANSTCDTRSQL